MKLPSEPLSRFFLSIRPFSPTVKHRTYSKSDKVPFYTSRQFQASDTCTTAEYRGSLHDDAFIGQQFQNGCPNRFPRAIFPCWNPAINALQASPAVSCFVQHDDILGGCVNAARDVFQEVVQIVVLLHDREAQVIGRSTAVFRVQRLM